MNEPHFLPADLVLYNKYISKAVNYFEYGSGGSTYVADKKSNVKKIWAVESDPFWYNKVKSLTSDKVTLLFVEMNTQPRTAGRPGPKSTVEQRKSYSDQIFKLTEEEIKSIDTVLLDGRFRAACLLKLCNVLDENCVIIFDDFTCRKPYHVVLDYYDIIDTAGTQYMVILKKKQGVGKVPQEIIEKYEDQML